MRSATLYVNASGLFLGVHPVVARPLSAGYDGDGFTPISGTGSSQDWVMIYHCTGSRDLGVTLFHDLNLLPIGDSGGGRDKIVGYDEYADQRPAMLVGAEPPRGHCSLVSSDSLAGHSV